MCLIKVVPSDWLLSALMWPANLAFVKCEDVMFCNMNEERCVGQAATLGVQNTTVS